MTRSCKFVLVLVALLLNGAAFALPSDSKQEISFEADQWMADDTLNTQTYSGSVEMVQGSLKIHADKIVIFHEGNRFSRIIATGQPARFSQIAQPGEEPIVAKARRMEYDVEGKTLQLIEKASIVQRGTSLSTGNRIYYDVQNGLVKAEGNKEDSEGRVRMVIPPEQTMRQESQEQSENEEPKEE